MQKMPESEFDYTTVYYHLKQHFSKHKSNREPTELQAEEKKLITALTKLSSMIIIPPSRLDDSIREVIKQSFGISPIETAAGLRVSTTGLTQINDEIYDLTVLGQIEEALRNYIVKCLRAHLKDVEAYVNQQEAEYTKMYESAWEEYETIMNQFEEGDYGYDYDGPIYPEKPNLKPFNRKATIAQRKQELAELDLDDPAVILEEVPIEKRLLGDMLHENFGDREFISDIIENLNFSGLSQAHITHFLRTKDFYFPDCNILKRGFLLEILIDNITHDFKLDRPKVDIHEHIAILFAAMSANEQCKALLKEYLCT